MAELGEAQVAIRANFDKFDKDIGGLSGKLDKALSGLAAGGALVAAAGITAIGAAAVKTGVDLVNMASDFQDATNALIVGTGASGEALADMEQIVKNLKGQPAGLGREFGELGAVVAEVNTRTGLTGESLDEMSAQILNLSRLAGGDAVKNTQLITRVMGDWGVATEDSADLMDQLFGASQAFGIGVDVLSGKLVQFGAPLRQMGFSLEESIAIFGKWEKEGVNTELVLGSLRIAAGKFAKENIPLRDGLNQTIEAIRGATDESEGLSIAMEVFGARAGPDMAAAIREGRFELDAAIESLSGTSGGLQDATDRALTLQDRFQLFKNTAMVALMPIGQAVLDIAEQALPVLQEIMTAMTPVLEDFAAEFSEKLGPALEIIGTNMIRIADALGLTNEEMTNAEAFAALLGKAFDVLITILEALAIASEASAFIFEKFGPAIKSMISPVWGLVDGISSLKDQLSSLEIPDWFTPGSPTPLEMGIKGINTALNNVPDFSSKFNFEPSFGGLSSGGGSNVSNNTTVNVGSVSATSMGGNPADDAIRMTVQLLRQQLQGA